MTVEIQENTNIFLSEGYMAYMGMKPGDMFEIVEMGGKMRLFPIADCSDELAAELEAIIAEHEATGPHKTYSCLDEMFRDMGIDLEEEDEAV